MDKEYFKKLVEPLGRFKKRYGEYDDYVFEPHPTGNLCLVCKKGHTINIERKFNRNDEPYWRWKCTACKNHWQNPPIT